MLYIGSHVSMSAPDYLVGSIKEALTYGANALMIYTGAPQNTRRKDIEEIKIEEAHALLKEHNIAIDKVVIHAPYIINLANTIKPETYELAVSFLEKEIERVTRIGAKYLVLHPGSHVKAGEDIGLQQIINGLNSVIKADSKVDICLETMAGKGSEIGYTFEQLKYIIDHVTYNQYIKICLDTCHIHDAGYDIVNDLDNVIDHFDQVIGLDRLAVIHVNDSKNIIGAKKDRHENLGYGNIGFTTLNRIVNHPKLDDVIKILETPYYDGKAPYKKEIELLRNQVFEDDFVAKL